MQTYQRFPKEYYLPALSGYCPNFVPSLLSYTLESGNIYSGRDIAPPCSLPQHTILRRISQGLIHITKLEATCTKHVSWISNHHWDTGLLIEYERLPVQYISLTQVSLYFIKLFLFLLSAAASITSCATLKLINNVSLSHCMIIFTCSLFNHLHEHSRFFEGSMRSKRSYFIPRTPTAASTQNWLVSTNQLQESQYKCKVHLLLFVIRVDPWSTFWGSGHEEHTTRVTICQQSISGNN